MVPNELAVSSISSILVPSLYKFNADSDRGASRFSEVSVKMMLSLLSSLNIFLTSFTSIGDMLPVIMFIFELGADYTAKCSTNALIVLLYPSTCDSI